MIRGAVVVAGAALLGCGAGPRAAPPSPLLEEVLAKKPRVLWIAAHGDDESLTGGFLAKACVGERLPCHFFVFNRDGGAECNLEEGCAPDMKTVRHREMKRATHAYHATLEQWDFFNAPLPVESFPTREKLEQIWMGEGDPIGLVARAVRRFAPDIVVTLDAYHGFTHHPEHEAAARIALAGIRMAADETSQNRYVKGEKPHRVRIVYEIQNKYWFMKLAGDSNDPKPYDETLDGTQVCDVTRHGLARECVEVRDETSRAHRSQDSDMGGVRGVSKFWGTVYLRHLDPFGNEASELVAELSRFEAAKPVAAP